MTNQAAEKDPHHHSTNIRQMLSAAADHIKKDIGVVTDPQARALFETTREVLGGLVRAFEHYESREPAWRMSPPET
ncbi:MAG TPA: hypothetical protein VGK52_05785 [Polyangia bacterium]|jgi:hypothetical protein